jgi:hypothetical protein
VIGVLAVIGVVLVAWCAVAVALALTIGSAIELAEDNGPAD